MKSHLSELISYRELIYMITWREIRIKYKQSVMGFLWAVFMPIIIVSAGVLVKYAFSLLSGKTFTFTEIATVSVKAIPWSFFVASIRFSTGCLIANTNLVTKIAFPKEIFPLASVLSQLLDFVVASAILVVILAVARIGISLHILWVPLLLLILIVFTMGLGLMFSAASLFFRDVKYLVEVILTFAIFFTPVFYEANIFGEWGRILMLNPVAPILEGINACVVYHSTPDLYWILYSGLVSTALLLVSFVLFKKLEPSFAESI
ncbi:MAG: hypothetical protein C4529_09645 [Deltaproteobacteria bacterium]|nr:MAG: hypothetical protein C4529_09645 [Deltaproteobacteria bacterium]